MQFKTPDWLATASYLAAASFLAHYVAATQKPLPDKLSWRWFLTSVPTCLMLGLVAAFLGDVMKLGQLGTVGLSALLGWGGTPILSALINTVIDKIKNINIGVKPEEKD